MAGIPTPLPVNPRGLSAGRRTRRGSVPYFLVKGVSGPTVLQPWGVLRRIGRGWPSHGAGVAQSGWRVR